MKICYRRRPAPLWKELRSVRANLTDIENRVRSIEERKRKLAGQSKLGPKLESILELDEEDELTPTVLTRDEFILDPQKQTPKKLSSKHKKSINLKLWGSFFGVLLVVGIVIGCWCCCSCCGCAGSAGDGESGDEESDDEDSDSDDERTTLPETNNNCNTGSKH